MSSESAWVPLVAAAIGAGASIYSSSRTQLPKADTTDYALLAQTQQRNAADAEAAQAQIDAARKREELRQQQLALTGVETGTTGTQPLSVRNQILGAGQ